MLRNALEKIQNLNSRQKNSIYMAIPVLLFGGFYFLFLSTSLDKFIANKKKIDSLQKKMREPTLQTLRKNINRFKAEIVNNKTAIDKGQKELLFLQNELDSKSFLFISKKSISQFLEKLLSSSLKHNILVQTITLNDKNIAYMGNLGLKKVINVTANGNFLQELAFLRSIENSNLLLKIEDIRVELLKDDLPPHLSFKVKFYGAQR